MASADFSRQILFQPHFCIIAPCVRETSRGKANHFHSMGIYVSGATGYVRLKGTFRKETRMRLRNILRRELYSIFVKEEPADITIYTNLQADYEVNDNTDNEKEPNNDVCKTNYMITIILELENTGFEQGIAELLHILYYDKIYLVNPGYGGVIIYPHDKEKAEFIIEKLKKYSKRIIKKSE